MILSTWCEIIFSKKGKISGGSKRKKPINEIKCDECGEIWIESSKVEQRFEKWNGYFCRKCLNIKHMVRLKECGTLALSKLTKEERKKNASLGGQATVKSPNFDYESFSTKRWAKMTEEERKNQVMKASKSFQKKLENPEYRKKHYEKIFKNSKIGYISKGQREVFNYLENENILGFVLDGILSDMKVDVINFEKKIAIEYNGDYYHCNPRTWNCDDYNKAINMKASEKWDLDRRRRFKLKNFGYIVIVIWESEWKINKEKYINEIKKYYYEIN